MMMRLNIEATGRRKDIPYQPQYNNHPRRALTFGSSLSTRSEAYPVKFSEPFTANNATESLVQGNSKQAMR